MSVSRRKLDRFTEGSRGQAAFALSIVHQSQKNARLQLLHQQPARRGAFLDGFQQNPRLLCPVRKDQRPCPHQRAQQFITAAPFRKGIGIGRQIMWTGLRVPLGGHQMELGFASL
ncbi:hypothetical protein D1872_293940 [compost metagenome]